MNLRARCPICEERTRFRFPGAGDWSCPACGHLFVGSDDGPLEKLDSCVVCGGHELYKKKDFPHWLGLCILAVACVAFLACHALYWPWLGWTILIGSAVVDGALYLGVRDVVVCYRCGTEYRGAPRAGEKEPFDLGTAERYRQERLRRAQLLDGGAPPRP